MRTRSSTRRWRLSGALVAAAVLMAACGNDDASSGDTPTTTAAATTTTQAGADNGDANTDNGDVVPEPDDVDPEGVFRVPTTALGILPENVTAQFDPIQLTSPAAGPQMLVYGTLLRARPDGTFEPSLAESASVVDARTIEIQIREGVKFSDGTPFDAEAVKFGLERNIASGNGGSFAVNELATVDSVTVDGPLTVTIRFNQDSAGFFYKFLSRGETMIVSPTAVKAGVDLMTNPVGAGPFLLESIEMERRIRFVKNPDYWNASEVRLQAVEIVHTASPEAVINAMRTGIADAVSGASVVVQDALADVPGLKVERAVSDSNLFWGQTCKAKAPLDDVRVRQALNFGMDRNQLNDIMFGGASEPMWGVNASINPWHDPALDGFYAHDPDKARALLTEAGYPNGFSIQALVPAGGGDNTRFTEVVQSQWAKIGVNLEIVSTANWVGEFFVDNQYPIAFFNMQQEGLSRILRTLYTDSGLGNVCSWSDPVLDDYVNRIRPLAPDSPEAITLWRGLDRHLLETAPVFFGLFGINGTVINTSRIGGETYFMNFQGIPNLDAEFIYIKKS